MRRSWVGAGLGFCQCSAGYRPNDYATIQSNSGKSALSGYGKACVDVGGASTADGTIVGPFPCNNQFNEQWIYANGQFLGLGTVGFGAGAVNKCLSVHNDSTAAGTGVELDTCIPGNTSQLWDLVGDSLVSEIVNVASDKCLDSLGRIGGGLQLVIETCNGSAGQKWNLK